MAEQQRNQADGSDDVSMDEILTSLRNILEEEDADQAGDQPAASEAEAAPAGDDQPPEDNGEEELVLTDVVEESAEPPAADAGEPLEPDPMAEASPEPEPATAPAEAGSEFDALFGRWDREENEAAEAEGTELDAGWSGPGEAEQGPKEPGLAAEEAAAHEDTGEAFELGDGDIGAPAEAAGVAEPSEAPAPAQPAEPPAPALDTEAVRETVEATVHEQVEQATADLDSRLAEALEPKIREALEGYLSDRLPALLRELAEAEIERIKKGE
jgi:D-alanyl-D-alanine carboxypeptidase/D-alanyl-D-alanine-endopeptidase (penicillin-binding protein 4)